jgi:uncharacterized membrane protein
VANLVFFWLLGLWMLGWAALPATRHVLAHLSDSGLAAGRVLFIALTSLFAFWMASFGLAPLRVVPILFATVALASLSLLLDQSERANFFAFLKTHRRALLVSDAVFVAAFLFFGWIRWRNPALNSLEKPMDAALLAQCWRADWLPIQNPWFAGTPLSGYYYFGPLMGAGLARCFGGAPWMTYNLVQPAFCALFISTLFSLCAALSRSHRRGFIALLLVAFLGHFEPLRQLVATGRFWPLDGWQTSRVITNTINEYPFFTLVVGDAHAHFYALALEAALLCVCWNFFTGTTKFDRTSVLRLCVAGGMLAVIVMTNPWAAPIAAVLVAACAGVTLPRHRWLWFLLAFAVARLLLWPHLRVFRPAIGGVSFEFWLPEVASFLLLWGGWLGLTAIAATRLKTELSERAGFALVTGLCGGASLLVPFGVTILGVFQDTPWRHQDTVFKFGLQAWLLLGTAAACGALAAWRTWARPWRVATLMYLPVPFLCAFAVVWRWSVQDVPRDANNAVALSLDGARHLPSDDREAVTWLSDNSKGDEAVLEAIGVNSYSQFGRVSALTGVPTLIGWPSHVSSWGGDSAEIERRRQLVETVYNGAAAEQTAALREVKQLKVRWILIGDLERRTYNALALTRLHDAHHVAFQSGETIILEAQ